MDGTILSVLGPDSSFMVTDGVKRNLSSGDTQQALKITTACPSEGWGMRVVSAYGEEQETEERKEEGDFLTPV